jgi:hypothetical protein
VRGGATAAGEDSPLTQEGEHSMILSRKQFKQLMDLKEVDWSTVDDNIRRACQVKCELVLDKLPSITAVEGVKNVLGAKYLIEQRVLETLEALGQTITDARRDELLVSRFLEGDQFPTAPKIAATLHY